MRKAIAVVWALLLVGALVVVPGGVKAENNGAYNWYRYYSAGSTVTKVLTLSSGSIVLVGYTGRVDGGDVFVALLDENGNIRWQQTYGGSEADYAYDAVLDSNGNIVIVGSTRSYNLKKEEQLWVLRINPVNGDLIWQKSYSEFSKGSAITTAPNGDLLIIADNNVIIRMDKNGKIKWAKGIYNGHLETITVTPNGDIIVAGFTESFGAGYDDVWVLRLDSEGNVKWQKTYGGRGSDWANAVAIAPNGDVIVAGYTKSFGAGSYDVWVLRLDANGNVKWQKTYGGSGLDGATAVAVAPNGDVIVVGSTDSFGAGYDDVWVLRLDSEGNVKWQKTYGGSGEDDLALAVAVAENGDIIVGGDFLLCLDENGSVKWAKDVSSRDIAITPDGKILTSSGYLLNPNGTPVWKTTWMGHLAITSEGKVMGVTGTEVFSFDLYNPPETWSADVEDVNVTVMSSNASVGASDAKAGNSNAIVKTVPKIPLDSPQDTNAQVSDSNATIQESNASVQDSTATVKTLWPVSLTINSTPPGAKVYINSTYKGETPLTLNLSPGTYEVKLIKEGYQEYTTTVTLSAGESKTLNIDLTPNYAHLTIKSDPSGAKVYINGNYKGKTPLTLELEPRTYDVKLTKQDYEEYTTTVTLSPGEEKTISATLTPEFGFLTVTSEPSGAKVYVDDNYIGETPINQYKLSTGEHKVKVEKSGYATFTKTITIKPGETTSVKATLTPLKATLKITSKPSGAKVYINGTYKDETPLTLELEPGTYTIKLTKDGYEDYTVTIELQAGETKEITAQLKEKPTTTTQATTSSTTTTTSNPATSTTTSSPESTTVSTSESIPEPPEVQVKELNSGIPTIPHYTPPKTQQKQLAEYSIGKAEELINWLRQNDFKINFANQYLLIAKRYYALGKYEEAKKLALNSWIIGFTEWQIQYEAEIYSWAGIDTTAFMQAYYNGNLDDALKQMDEAKTQLSGEAKDLFTTTQETFETVKSYWQEGIKLWNHVDDLKASTQEFKAGNVEEAKSLGEKALRTVKDIGEMARQVLNQLKDLGDSVFNEGRGGNRAQELFERAMELFERGEFEQVKQVIVEIKEVIVTTTTKKGWSLCGPAALIGLATIPLLLRRKRKNG